MSTASKPGPLQLTAEEKATRLARITRDDENYYFTVTTNRETAPNLRLETVFTVPRDDTNSLCSADDNAPAVILHHMVNTNKWHQKRGKDKRTVEASNDRFWGFMPPVRKRERQVLELDVIDAALDAVYATIVDIINKQSKLAADLGLWTQTGDFSTFNYARSGTKSTQKHKKEELKTAAMAVTQVNDAKFEGKLYLDGLLMGLADNQLEQGIRTTLREQGADLARMNQVLAYVQGLIFEYETNNGQLRPFEVADLRRRD